MYYTYYQHIRTDLFQAKLFPYDSISNDTVMYVIMYSIESTCKTNTLSSNVSNYNYRVHINNFVKP